MPRQSSLGCFEGQRKKLVLFGKAMGWAFKVGSWPTFLEVNIADFNDSYFYKMEFGPGVVSFLNSFYSVKTSSGYARK